MTERTIIEIEVERPPLQPLRIPEGWTVTYNNALFEVDLDPTRVDEDDAGI